MYMLNYMSHLMTSRWTIDLFKTGYRKILQTEDLYTPLKIDRSNILGDRLEKFVLVFKSIFYTIHPAEKFTI